MCIFCKIINGEIPSYKVYEDEKFLAFLDISQATIGHTLVVPKKHYANIFELDEETSKQIFDLTRRLSIALSKALSIDSINIINNSGLLAGQTVNHFHIHLIPRYENDNLIINFSSNKLEANEFNDIASKINKIIQ